MGKMESPPKVLYRYVFFEDSGEEREVVGGCSTCGVTEDDLSDKPFWLPVSPTGLAHHSDEYGRTRCGKDATRMEWWWPL